MVLVSPVVKNDLQIWTIFEVAEKNLGNFSGLIDRQELDPFFDFFRKLTQPDPKKAKNGQK